MKAHPFFKGTKWENLFLENSPAKISINRCSPVKKGKFSIADFDDELVGDTDDTYDDFGDLGRPTKKTKAKIVKTGLVRKLKLVFMYNTRQLILYNNATMSYFNPQNNEKKGLYI